MDLYSCSFRTLVSSPCVERDAFIRNEIWCGHVLAEAIVFEMWRTKDEEKGVKDVKSARTLLIRVSK